MSKSTWVVEITVSNISAGTDEEYETKLYGIERAIRDIDSSYGVDVGIGEEDINSHFDVEEIL